MSMIPRCSVCDARVANIYAPDSRCPRCQRPCPTCQGDVAMCQHPLPILDLEPREIAPGRWSVAA